MTLRHGHWVECDACGEPSGDAGTPIPAPFPTPQEAIVDAVENCEWTQDPATGRLLCHNCAEVAAAGEGIRQQAHRSGAV
ncbi:hypothetical protein [Nocardia asiatica]|uniref:hypothetical protein n=1 Tax=Nocardia asiatica TaxID=209252 RepID=UPI00031B688D|nr:hypothetical protein [Nocardia asiatica]